MLLSPRCPVPEPPAGSPPVHPAPSRRQDEGCRPAPSPRNELLSLLTLNRYPLELTSANHAFFPCFLSQRLPEQAIPL